MRNDNRKKPAVDITTLHMGKVPKPQQPAPRPMKLRALKMRRIFVKIGPEVSDEIIGELYEMLLDRSEDVTGICECAACQRAKKMEAILRDNGVIIEIEK